jgi:perosamine synthetase
MIVPDTASMRDALRVIDRNACGVGFVVDTDGRLQGVVTDGDVRRAILRDVPLEAKVVDFMTANPVSVDAGTAAEKIIGLMSGRIKYIPLTDKEGRVVDFAAFSHAVHLPIASPVFRGNELRYVTECVLKNWISSQGRFVVEFEHAFAKFCGVKHGIAVSNGTVALHLALVMSDIGPGDEVIVPTLTFIATANAVRYTGATPVFVDSDQDTWGMNPSEVERKITSKTKAILPVHLYGQPVDMDPINDLAGRHNLVVIEDAAEAHGALYKGKKVGSLGDIGCFSFFANKVVTTGEGGMLVTNDDQLAERARILRDHGMSRTRKYWHEVVGYNYRLTNLQAAVGVAQMEQVEFLLEQRAKIGAYYDELLGGDDRIERPRQISWGRRVTWLYTVLLRQGTDRDRVITRLKETGIDSRPVFYPVHTMPPYACDGAFPVAESLSRRGLSLPTHVSMGRGDVERIGEALRRCLDEEDSAP